MIDHYRVVLALLAARVFLPNVLSGARTGPSCDPKATLVVTAERRGTGSASGGTAAKTADDRWAGLATSAPGGFAGAYLETSAAEGKATVRRLIVRLARPQERDAALRVILPKLREIDGEEIDRGGVVVTSARWDFAQLVEWRRYLEPHANAVAKILAAEIDQRHNWISYRVGTRRERDALLEHLGTLRIPCGLVDVVLEGSVPR